MKVEYYLSSGCDMPDWEGETELKDNKCIIYLTDSPEDIHGYKCNTEITWDSKKGLCKNCGAGYWKEEA